MQRPATGPTPIVPLPHPAPHGVPHPGGPPPMPGPPAPAPPPPPYQSQIIPQFQAPAPPYPAPHPPSPAGTGAIAGPPPPPGSSSRTGTLPSVQAVTPVTGPVAPVPAPAGATGQYPMTGPPRITVQYPKVGTTLTSSRGSYIVRDVIGSGEFGAVYDCIGPFDQVYALKMVRPANRPYSEVQAEWAREVQRLFSLRHPNVVYIYDSFEQGHLYYLALERCDHALKEMLGTPMQEGLIIEMTRQLLAAVQFLHDNDVVHDDLHAGNVLITHNDRPTVKISDFGISHELRGMPAIRPNVVHHAIMAPEILATGYTSKQSDLYQVGLLLYWMLTGEPAIQMDVPYQELVRQVAEGEPRKRAESVGTPLGNLIAKMLRRREAFRYTSAREVWADLRELPAWRQRHLFPVK
ncbi:Ubiquinone biosynthesis monooxygenase UbiB [Labilithrix luteola]|uniref:Ubiquinone biosynthesis monooxygenase UbiB n=2 Tax=Labilithrix luteola TaxID=1391654 RepID=A0A0K1Q7G3_9BACT|nr:Ubiquinone biosynthesis monooxygenase UbiB [Labilithrix luteola]